MRPTDADLHRLRVVGERLAGGLWQSRSGHELVVDMDSDLSVTRVLDQIAGRAGLAFADYLDLPGAPTDVVAVFDGVTEAIDRRQSRGSRAASEASRVDPAADGVPSIGAPKP